MKYLREESRTPKETQSESTRSSDFFIIARLKFTKLIHCCILFITKCLCYVFRKLSNNHTKLKLENHSSVSILAAFFWYSRLNHISETIDRRKLKFSEEMF